MRKHKEVHTLDLSASGETPAINVEAFRYCGIVISTSGVADNTGEFAIEVSNAGSGWAPLEADGLPALADANADLASGLVLAPFDRVRVAFTAAGSAPDGTAQVFVTLKD